MRFRRSNVLRYLLCLLVPSYIVWLFYRPEHIEVRHEPVPAPEPNTLISYEDISLAKEEANRVGPGEQGAAVRLFGEQKVESEKFLNQNGFNTYISDMIAIDRAVADIRHPKCKAMLYLAKLPSVSLVIPFFQENWNALLRTFVSSLKRSPPGLIKEVILVDDGSTREYLKEPLDRYLEEHYPDGLVRVIRSPRREGLITARIRGARAATGDVLVFLDSHCEPNPNWLPPLVDPIARDHKVVTCPFIDVISADTFEYRAQDEGARGAFDWELFYKRLPKLPQDLPHPEQPFDSPVMAGGLFAISAKWFWELGGYDPGLVIWGGEQYELSFKIWMCGGRMIDIPCSRIGHIYRTHPTDFPSAGLGDFLGKNYKRVAETWMDEYKEYIYSRRPHYRHIDAGDLSEQKAVRERLQCKPFKWFMQTIAFDLTKKYPLVEPVSAATGDVRPVVDRTLCVDAEGATKTEPIKLKKCLEYTGGNGVQKFELSYTDDIRPVKHKNCWDLPHAGQNAPVVMFECHGMHGNQHWIVEPLEEDNRNPILIKHALTNYCLEAHATTSKVVANVCNRDVVAQHWVWEKLQFDEAKESKKRAGL
ncbi:glycosyltransferase, group 2 family protein [Opisthorchis viverrini]|uniref:Polypeptide N-acetylgalactosaminyltransferase n=2 Tax=Opisthorchis viverrini TaxID=6198 RepID=A0A074ZHM9_OPIVI|nr:hypothetical protein T265_14248 [Opisthorchis viverrini]KER25232.1 hypothetical protein T265_14248 [Opisthorchis viverrini]OON19771.1 glycosyltransferase, group 2 family protein [Opisthorchis viverrini]